MDSPPPHTTDHTRPDRVSPELEQVADAPEESFWHAELQLAPPCGTARDGSPPAGHAIVCCIAPPTALQTRRRAFHAVRVPGPCCRPGADQKATHRALHHRKHTHPNSRGAPQWQSVPKQTPGAREQAVRVPGDHGAVRGWCDGPAY